MKLLFILTILSGLIACHSSRPRRVIDVTPTNYSCSVIPIPDGQLVQCPNYQIFVPNGRNGTDGKDGADGQDGTSSVINIIDPCGDSGNGPDEILLVMEDGSIIAWYKNLGLSVLTQGVTYVTTDSQRCRFRVLNGTIEEL